MVTVVESAGQPARDETGKWATLGRAVLAFHYRVGISATCRCGRTVIECDVQHHARQLGLLPPTPASPRRLVAPPELGGAGN